MATKDYTIVWTPYSGSGIFLVKWEELVNGDDGTPFPCPAHADKSVQIIGTFGTGGTLVVEGSNMVASPTYATLVDPQGNALSFTSAKIEQILENVYQLRPRVTAGDGTTDLDVYLLVATNR